MFADYHMHSDYSDDCFYPMEDVVKDAIAIGLEEIVFTEHVDYGVKKDRVEHDEFYSERDPLILNVDYPAYFKEINELKEKYKDQITIKVGMEFGMQMHTIPAFQKLYDDYDYDFVLLSIHQVGNQEFYNGKFQVGRSIEECYDAYYEELYDLVRSYKDYSCLAHMDLIRRYTDKERDLFEYNKDLIAEILKVVIEDGKGIEVNTSHDRYGINGITPSLEILKLYHQLGGTIITIGSDSHKKEHLAYKVKESMELLKEIGFEYFCTFDKMKPVFHKL